MGRDSYSDISGFDNMNTVCLPTSKHIFFNFWPSSSYLQSVVEPTALTKV